MGSILKSIGALLISAAILLAGGGLLSTLTGIRAEIEGFPLSTIGLLLSGYYIGFVSSCFATPKLVQRVGHIRVFAALASLTAGAVMMHVMAVQPVIWFILRVITGFCFAGLYMIIESWINERSSNEMRGQVLSVYRVVDLAAVTAGQFLLTAGDPSTFFLFALVTILICISVVPVSLTTEQAPAPLRNTSLNLKKLMKVSPFAVAGTLCVGLANGAFWGIAPVFIKQLGYSLFMVSTFMSVAIIAGAALQWPVGWISDRIDRRKVLVAMAGLSALSGAFLWQMAAVSVPMLLLGGALFGACAMQIFGLAAAHANDHAEPDEFVAVSGGLLLIYGMGSVFGPIFAPLVMRFSTPSALFAYTGAVHAVLFVYGLYRMTARESVSLEDQEDFRALPRTTPTIFRLMRPKKPKVPKPKLKPILKKKPKPLAE